MESHSLQSSQGKLFCYLCGKPFCSRNNLECHICSAHYYGKEVRPRDPCQGLCSFFNKCDGIEELEGTIKEPTSKHSCQQTMECPICGREFTRQDSLKRHQRTVHRSEFRPRHACQRDSSFFNKCHTIEELEESSCEKAVEDNKESTSKHSCNQVNRETAKTLTLTIVLNSD